MEYQFEDQGFSMQEDRSPKPPPAPGPAPESISVALGKKNLNGHTCLMYAARIRGAVFYDWPP